MKIRNRIQLFVFYLEQLFLICPLTCPSHANIIWGPLDFQIKSPGGRWLPEMPRVIRNNKLSNVHIIPVLLEDAFYICTLCTDSILRPREHLNIHEYWRQSSAHPTSVLLPFLYATYRGKRFFKYSLQVLRFKFFSRFILAWTPKGYF